jgi:hypothetical protein
MLLADLPSPRQYLSVLLTQEIGLSEKSAALLIEEHGELDVQRHAMYCLWTMDQGKVHIPPAWFTASLKHHWSAPNGMPSDWLPTVLRFRVDENTFAEFTRIIREDKKAT